MQVTNNYKIEILNFQKWNDQIAEAAQKWTQNCKFLTHDNNDGRFIPNYGPCGQNIFVATQKVPW